MEKIKAYQHDDHRFSEWYKHKESNPLLKRKGLNGFTLSVSQRLTKYPILIDAQIKKVGTDDIEREKLERAKKMIKNILEVVNACVAEQNKADRRFEIFKRIDAKSTIMFKNSKFSKADMMHDNRKLKLVSVIRMNEHWNILLALACVRCSDQHQNAILLLFC